MFGSVHILFQISIQFLLYSISLHKVEASQSLEGLCFEKIANEDYLSMIPHPDGSSRAFLSNQQGVIWLANIPDEGCGGTLDIIGSEPFFDISDQVISDSEYGLMSMAFHPNFAQNGRFFLSYNCDKMKNPKCSGRCSCNTDVNCDPSKLRNQESVEPCQYHSMVAEFTANQTATSFEEVRRIFSLGLPRKGNHAGQILFGPQDGFLYVMTADGSRRNDPYNFAQNKRSLLGKILRLDVDRIPSQKEINKKGMWGNYSVPIDNPFVDDKDLEPEIWALGFRNPWRCSFDSQRPSYFICGDCGQDQYEEIDIVIKGGNYGWRVYEGPFLFHPTMSPGGNTSANSISPIFPVMGYNHSKIIPSLGSTSIIGGYFYRSITNPCIYGRYLFTDAYAGAIWVGTESPKNSKSFSASIAPFLCANDSPIQCSSHSDLGFVYSWAEDNNKDVFLLSSNGVYRIARPSRCNLTCAKETVVTCVTHRQHSTSSNSTLMFFRSVDFLLCFIFFVYVGFIL